MTAFVVSIGSNVLEHEAMMSRTVKWLEEQFDDVRVSEIYETPEYSRRYDPYFNCVASASTCMSLDDAVKLMKEWEMKCGRTHQSKITGKVVIDLDIVILCLQEESTFFQFLLFSFCILYYLCAVLF